MERFNFEHANENREKKDFLLDIALKIDAVSESTNLSGSEIQEQCQPLIKELLDHLESDLNVHVSGDVNAFYAVMERENLLARVESVKNILACISQKIPIHVGSNENHYANAVAPHIEGLRIAMAEADAIGPIRLMVGLDLKALVGFKSDHLEVSEVDDSEFDVRDTSLRKSMCRHVVGEIHSEDVRCMILRIPRAYFPESELDEKEKEQASQFIFRGIELPQARGGADQREALAA